MRIIFVAFCCLVLPTLTTAVSSTCEQGSNCKLPKCFCSTYQHPTIKNSSQIPQIVYFGFDDALTTVLPQYYDTLFPKDRRNPNGCPIGMTLYVSHKYTSYPLVKQYYQRGMEIAVHSVTHSHIKTREAVLKEARQQKRNIAINSGIPSNEIIGWRSPFLETAGDAQADVLQKLGYEYDISLTYKRSSMNSQNPFPFTLDYGWTFYCQIRPCPLKKHPGFWEFPVNSLIDYKGQYPCGYVDGCYNAPKTEDDAFKYLYNNFLSAYNGNRAPFGLHMHAGWFYTDFHLSAMDRFIKEILTRDDVYIVTTKQALQWMQDPRELRDIKHYRPWSCPNQIVPTTTTTTTTTTTSKPAPKVHRKPKPNQPIGQNFVRRPTKWFGQSVSTVWRPNVVQSAWGWGKTFRKPSGFIMSRTSTRRPRRLPTTTTTTTQPTTTTLRTTTTAPTTTPTTTTVPPTTTTVKSTTTVKATKLPQIPITLPWMNPWSMTSAKTAQESKCIQGANCFLPRCFCAGTTSPGNLKVKDIPQLVYLTFEGNIDVKIYRQYEKLIHSGRVNPNKCPISATYFITDQSSKGPLVQRLHNIGAEISIRGFTSFPLWEINTFKDELKNEFASLRRLRIFDVKGWRSPNLTPHGDSQFKELQNTGFAYDATLSVKNNDGKMWPHTLDFGWKNSCIKSECPKNKYPGLWEVPAQHLMDYVNRYECDYVDGCVIPPSTANDTFNMLWNGFLQHYNSNRAPYGLNFRHIWFSHQFFEPNIRGLEMFLDKLAQFDDVYIVPIRDVIEWIRHPTPIPKLKSSRLWKCRTSL